MTLFEKLESISLPRLANLTYGKAYSIEEFWNDVIKSKLPKKEVVLAWHKLLMEYVNDVDHPCYVFRGYNTCGKNKNLYHTLRRGFLTDTKNFSFFYTDNFFAAYIEKMVIDDFVPTLEEFSYILRNRKFPLRFGRITQEERELMAIKQGKDPKIHAAGYKLAHILPTGKDYFLDDQIVSGKQLLDTYFPRGERSDWCLEYDDELFYLRRYSVDDDAVKYSKALFLRFVHPFNYFLCPKPKCQTNNFCSDIAEYEPLQNYAHDYMLSMYGDKYIEYLNMIFPDNKYFDLCYDDNTSKMEIEYGLNINKKEGSNKDDDLEDLQIFVNSLMIGENTPKILKELNGIQEKINTLKTQSKQKQIQTPSKSNNVVKHANKYTNLIVDEKVKLEMALEYLSNSNSSFRKLEVMYLGIDSPDRGGGFVAKEIINSLGIVASQKGILERISLDLLISDASDILLDTLNKIKNLLH
jgi:hypothetical protein